MSETISENQFFNKPTVADTGRVRGYDPAAVDVAQRNIFYDNTLFAAYVLSKLTPSDLSGIVSAVALSGEYSDLGGAPSNATQSSDGLMSSVDKAKLDTVESRVNHTGTQTAATISDFSSAADARISQASIGGLTDVDLAGLADGQALVFNLTSGNFEPGSVASSLSVESDDAQIAAGVQVLNFSDAFALTDNGGGQVTVAPAGTLTEAPSTLVGVRVGGSAYENLTPALIKPILGYLEGGDNIDGSRIGDYGIKRGTLSISSGTVNIDYTAGPAFTLTLTESVTSFVISNWPPAGQEAKISLRIVQDGTGGRTVAFPGAWNWPGASAPAVSGAPNAVDRFVLISDDSGTTVDAVVAGQDFS